MLAGLSDRPPNTLVSVRSDDLCREAALVYGRLFRRSTSIEPDSGMAERYASGCRCLEARARSEPWPVPAPVVEQAEELLRLAGEAPNAQVDEWIDRFPRVFLALIDRRHQAACDPDTATRRFVDRVAGVRPKGPEPMTGRDLPVVEPFDP